MLENDRVDFCAVVPTYNRATYLSRALDSILEQSHPAREIVVVDDGSSDLTASLVRKHYPQVRYHYQRHAGVSAARNAGVSLSTSRWVALLDSDDAWHPDKLREQAQAIDANPGMRLVHTNERWIRNGEPLLQKRHHQKYGGHIFEHCLARCVISPSSAAIHRDVFTTVGWFDESLKACEDYDFWLRYCAREGIVYLDRPLITKFGGHDDQLSRRTLSLDQFRIRALCNLLDSGILSEEQKVLAIATLLEKAQIFANGARKRGHQSDVDKCAVIVRRFARA